MAKNASVLKSISVANRNRQRNKIGRFHQTSLNRSARLKTSIYTVWVYTPMLRSGR